MENQDRYEAIFRLALTHAKAVSKTAVGGDSIGLRAALAYVGMVASEYSLVTGKELDVRYTIFHGDNGTLLHLHNTPVLRWSTVTDEELPASGSCRQLYENSPLFKRLNQSQTEEETQEDGPCLQL